MAGAEPIYYWDTCLFLAWIKDEQRPSGEMDGVREIIERFRRRECKIVTSVLTSVEVLDSRLPVGLKTLFYGLMKRLGRLGMETKVAAMAHDLRDHYTARSAEFGGKTLSTPDAIHLATAILYRVTEFHTFDNDGNARNLGLLPLSGNVGGHGLIICKPKAKRPQLDLRKPSRKITLDPTTPSPEGS
jgi:predicted nucleic acid-binding protein